MIAIKQMGESEIPRIAEIDRTEHVTLGYVHQDGRLLAQKVDWRVPPWSADDGPHSVQGRIEGCRTALEHGGAMFGAFDADRLVGCAVLRYELTDGMAQLAGLWVSDGYRRKGIAARLTDEVFRLARERGAERIYVSGTPSESAVGFYRSQGFRLADQVNEELFEEEPEDIHMIKTL